MRVAVLSCRLTRYGTALPALAQLTSDGKEEPPTFSLCKRNVWGSFQPCMMEGVHFLPNSWLKGREITAVESRDTEKSMMDIGPLA